MTCESSSFSRRDLFKHLKMLKKDVTDSLNGTEDIPNRRNASVSRREFGKISVAAAVKFALDARTNSVHTISTTTQSVQDNGNTGTSDFVTSGNPLVSDLRGENEDMDKKSLSASFLEGAAWGIGNSVIGNLIRQKGVSSVGNPTSFRPQEQSEILRKIENHPVGFLSHALVIAPIVEELTFRDYPKRKWADNKDMRWDIGIGSSAAFALYHNITGRITPPEIRIDTKHIHALAFPFGLFAWQKVKTEGYYHAVAAHAGHNFASTAYSFLRRSKKEKQV